MGRVKNENKYSAALLLALTEHRNEKNQILELTPESFQWELYNEAWDKDVVIMKSTQCGITEWAIVTALALAEFGLAHFYVLPTEPDRNKFLAGKLEKSIRFSPYYRNRMKDISGVTADNKSIKIYGGTNLVFVGSNSPTGFTMATADVVTIDEVDQCEEENLPMADERLSHSEYRIKRLISNPTYEGTGIAVHFAKSDKRYWTIPHECGHEIRPDFFKHLANEDCVPFDKEWEPEKEPRLICDHCKKPFDRMAAGKWVKTAESKIRGYHISKLFSTQVTLLEILNRYKEGLEDDSVLQRFYNGDLGLPYTAKGSKITRELLDFCVDKSYRFPLSHKGPCLIGIDPGSRIHMSVWYQNYELERWDLVFAGWATDKRGIDEVIRRFSVVLGVIDAGPELQLVKTLMSEYLWLWRADYGQGTLSKTETKEKVDIKTRKISVNRTFEMDRLKTFVAKGLPRFPANISKHDSEDFYSHLQAPVRVFDEKRETYVWKEGTLADHYFHSIVYFLQARKLWVYLKQRETTSEVLL